MSDFWLFMALTAAMGLSIFLSLPIVYSKRAQGRWAVGLNAAAIGILVFLLADVFSDVSPILYPTGYVANLDYSVAVGIAFLVAFLGLYFVDNLPRSQSRAVAPGVGSEEATSAVPAESSPRSTALIIALGIGLQNLTEGLVFGVNWTLGALGILAVVFIGFFLQNVTEGFPIASPFLGNSASRRFPVMVGLFLVGGLPTLLGGAIGYYWSNHLFLVIFDALAIGAIAYVILPMLRVAFRPLESREASIRRNRLVYIGVMVGFLLGFAVNAI
ncbi:MAG: ZIP family metal transporter [Thermoplasmata archaeon]